MVGLLDVPARLISQYLAFVSDQTLISLAPSGTVEVGGGGVGIDWTGSNDSVLDAGVPAIWLIRVTTVIRARHPIAQPPDLEGFGMAAPQCTQYFASELICFLHSWQSIRAMPPLLGEI